MKKRKSDFETRTLSQQMITACVFSVETSFLTNKKMDFRVEFLGDDSKRYSGELLGVNDYKPNAVEFYKSIIKAYEKREKVLIRRFSVYSPDNNIVIQIKFLQHESDWINLSVPRL